MNDGSDKIYSVGQVASENARLRAEVERLRGQIQRMVEGEKMAHEATAGYEKRLQQEMDTMSDAVSTSSREVERLRAELAACAAGPRQTATPINTEEQRRRLAMSSSGLLIYCAQGLFSERIQALQENPPRGRGGDSEDPLKTLVTLSCPSDSGRAVLALTTDGKDCSCSPNYRTPTARDWKGMSAKSWREREKGDKTPTLPDQIGGTPHPEFVEKLMGFKTGWTDLKQQETR